MRGPLVVTLLRRNGALLLTSFLVSGLVNVHAQAFFGAHVPGGKEKWLAGALLTGTLASIAAVRLSKAWGFGRTPALVGPGLVALMLGAAGALFGVAGVWAYAALHVLVRGTANYLTQELDRRAIALAASDARARNDQIGSGLRFCGMLLGPLWLGMFAQARWATFAVLLALGALAVSACLALARAPLASPSVEAPRAPLSSPRRSDARIWIAGVCIYGSYYLLASSAVYVLRDVQGRADAAKVGSALIATVYASAIVGTVVIGLITRRGLPLGWMRVAPVTMVAAGLALRSAAAGELAALFAGGAVLGIAFALFLLSFREHVTARVAAGETHWLPRFNNLGNNSALVGFGAMGVLVALKGVMPGGYADRLALGLLVLSAVALGAGAGARPAIAFDSAAP